VILVLINLTLFIIPRWSAEVGNFIIRGIIFKGQKMNKKKLILVLFLFCIVALSSFMLFREVVVKGELPEWVPQNLQEEIKSLNATDPEVKGLILEIQSIHLKNPKNPPQELIERIKNEIEGIKYQESIYVSTPSKLTPEEIAHLKDIPTFYTEGKPYCIIDLVHADRETLVKNVDPSELKMYDFTSTVILPYAELTSGSQKADLSSVAPGMKGDPTLGITEYAIIDSKTGKEIGDTSTFPGKGAPTAVKVIGTVVYFQFKNGEILAFDTSYPLNGNTPSMKFVSVIP
jgi:hypothetical protein